MTGTSSPLLRVAIIGCGVAGSVLGTLLSRLPGIETLCFESASVGDHAEAGTGLNVGPNAMKALRLVAPDWAETVRAASFDWARWRVAQVDGTPVFDFALTDLADEPGIRIRWSELYRVLRAPVHGFARFGCKVTHCGFDPARPGKLVVETTDASGREGREDGFDLVVATDGRYSTLRPQFAGTWASRHVGVTIYRLLVPDTSNGLIDDYGWWFNGPKRLLSFRVPDNAVYIAGSFPVPPGQDIPADQCTPEALACHYLPAQGQPCAEVEWMVRQLVEHHAAIHWARLQETPALFRDPTGQVLFLGDAAHGMVPTLGQGATQSLEDACIAGHLIGRMLARRAPGAVTPAEVAALTQRISDARLDRVQWVMDYSLECTAAMLQGANGPAEMARLRAPEHRAHFRRLWAGVSLPGD